MKVDGKRTIITGASSGIGSALALALARRGAALVLAARRQDRLTGVAETIRAACPGVPPPLTLVCDVAKAESARAMIQAVAEKMGGVDILINNAGTGVYGSNEKTPMEDFRLTMEVNFFGAAQCMFEVLPLMRRQGNGLIVNIASIAAIHGVPYMGVYCASKAALASLSQSLRAELTDTGIRVMVVYPGYTQTEFFEKEKNVGGGRRPDGPCAPVEEVAESIARGIERGKRELVLPLQGKAMKLSESLAPWIVERAMRGLARRLASTPPSP